MIRQKSEDYHLDGGPSAGGDGLTSPGTKRKNESTFRQLQNDVMGKARSTLSTLGDVWKTSKSTLSGGGGGGSGSGAQSGDQYHDTGGGGDGSDYDGRGGPESGGYEGQFSTPPRSPKSAKDKSSLDFFLWPKGKSKDGSSKGSQKKDKSSKGQSAGQEPYDSSHQGSSKGRGAGQKEPPMSPGTGTIRKQTFGSGQGPGPGPGSRGPPSNHHHQQHYQQQQQQQQQPHYQHSSRAMKYRYEYGESSGDDFRQRSLDETSEYSRSMEDNMAYVGRGGAGDDDTGEDGDLRYDDRYYGSSNTPAPRPKSYNEKYSSQYYDYAQGYDHHHRPRSQRSQQQQQQQQRPFDYDDHEQEQPPTSGNQSALRKSAQNASAASGSASANNPSSPAPAQKHILFNEENDILYFKENQRPSKTKSLNEHQSRAEKQQQQQTGRGPSKSASYPKDGGRKMGDQDPVYRQQQQQQQQQQQLSLPSPQPTTSALRKVSRDERANAGQQQQQVRSAPTTPSAVSQNEPNIIRATLKLEKLSSSGAPLGDTGGGSRGGNAGDAGEQQSTSKPTKGIQKQFSTIVNLSRGGGGASGSSTLPRGGLEYGGGVSKAGGDGGGAGSGRLPGTILEEDLARQSATGGDRLVAGSSEGEKRSTGRKICFKDEPVDGGALERLKCQTLPRSAGRSSVRSSVRTDGPNTDPSVNEYLDTDMTLPRRGSLDSDLESQAMRIVRTVGQAFEVCHKLTMQDSGDDNLGDDHSELSPCDVSEQDRCSDRISEDDDIKKDPTKSAHDSPRLTRPDHLDLATLSHPSVQPSPAAAAAAVAAINSNSTGSSSSSTMHQHHRSSTSALQSQQDKDGGLDVGSLATQTPLTASREMSSLREQLDQQQQQTRQVLAQLMLVREQLISETNARMDAQARIQQLLQQNRELLEHIASLGGYHEPDRPGLSATAIGIAPQLSSTAKVARWFHTLQWTNQSQSLSRPESGFVSGDSRSERNQKSDVDMVDLLAKDHATSGTSIGGGASAVAPNGVDLCDEYLLVEGTSNLWSKLSVKKRKKLLGLKLGKVTTF
ncbi:hornerin-like isoform X2 [Anopheles albimanus]|uniref:hornerin-like isoform X2 n=1 Tax=Anopheles albimanus TaxID=7167 RepID=UPI0016417CD3|nr:hornerin-like isoform X2 [Anopheles albimanus]